MIETNAAASADTQVSKAALPGPVQMIDALNGVFGTHAKARASHAKGFQAIAEFIPDPQIGDFVSNKLFSQASLAARIRFSIGGGNPGISDKSRTVRGLSIRLQQDEETYDLVLISEPAFFAATPESFVSFLQARVADPETKKPDPEKIAAHNLRFPEGKIQPGLLAAHAAPASYATTSYFSNNAFGFRNKQGLVSWARVQVEAVAGTQYLSEDQEKNLPDAFLEDELKARIAESPAEFIIYAQLPAEGDSLTDPSQVWQVSERRVLGTLRVTAVLADGGDDAVVFLPLQLPEGIQASDDPILKARAAAYAVSLARRSR
ncbi:catalase [Undibacterium terreum]|uniref:Catalase-related peroxidase n=1 Tax=Undibacterium terreum TaxID=1224302 RepID=A0A916XAF5_9BURK|nr:catalase [Undibacterium terreum]GGC57411.1 catalase-related peroxidase [Undibacterium terreum]